MKSKLIEKKYLVTFILVTSLFALWGFANDITNPMVAAFQTVMELSPFEASWVQFAFYGGYATMAVPAALFIRRYSYKSGILLGLGLYAIGAFLFIPAAYMQNFIFFCMSLYILTFGLAFLETTANPFILSLGSKDTSTRRLNFAQAFNPMGSLLGMAVASFIVLPSLVSDFRSANGSNIYEAALSEKAVVIPDSSVAEENAVVDGFTWVWAADANIKEKNDTVAVAYTDFSNYIDKSVSQGVDFSSIRVRVDSTVLNGEEKAPLVFTDKEKGDVRYHDLNEIRNPYVMLGVVVVLIFIVFVLKKMPQTSSEDKQDKASATLRRLWHNTIYREGVVAQMFYVAAQIMVWTFIIQYADNLGINKATAQNYNIVAMIMFLCSRFITTFLMKYVNSRVLLAVFGVGAMLCSLGTILFVGMAGLYCLVAISAFMSLMFPTIYGIALEDVDSQDTSLGAAFLVMAIVGGAVMPPLQGLIIGQEVICGCPAVNISFVLPLVCFLVVTVYGMRSYKKMKG